MTPAGQLLHLLEAHVSATVFAWAIARALVPLPSPSVLMIAGALVVPAAASWSRAALVVFFRLGLPGAAGTTLGSWVYYQLARSKGPAFAERYAPAVGLRKNFVRRMERLSSGHKGFLCAALFAVPFVPLIVASAACGLAGASKRRFAAGCFAGSLIRCCVLALAGRVTRETYGPVLAASWKAWPLVLLGTAAAAAALLKLRARGRTLRRSTSAPS